MWTQNRQEQIIYAEYNYNRLIGSIHKKIVHHKIYDILLLLMLSSSSASSFKFNENDADDDDSINNNRPE